MHHNKPFKDLIGQAQLIIDRGCVGDKNDIVARLAGVNYYRLSGYLYPFRKIDPVSQKRLDSFEDGTTFRDVWDTYRFDRRLRFLLLDAIERIEIALRTRIAYRWAESTARDEINNPQGDRINFRSNYPADKYDKLIKIVQNAYDASETDCAKHHKHDLHIEKVEGLPIWVFVEFMTFGNTINLFNNGLPQKLALSVAQSFNVPNIGKISSILAVLRETRNFCAHHERTWNRSWMYKPKTAISLHPCAPKMGFNLNVSREKTAYVLLICEFMLKTVVPQSSWKKRVLDLFDEIPLSDKKLSWMGFPRDALNKWRDTSIG